MNSLNKVKLIAKNVRYFCLKDEDAFFEWIKKIECVDDFDGIRDELYLYIKSNQISSQGLRDLIGLFYRYNVEMSQLKQFLNDENKKWFYDNKQAFWHKKVFGKN